MGLQKANEEAVELGLKHLSGGFTKMGLHRANEEAAELGLKHLRGGYT